jgi:hypothetical protein
MWYIYFILVGNYICDFYENTNLSEWEEDRRVVALHRVLGKVYGMYHYWAPLGYEGYEDYRVRYMSTTST